MKKNKVWTIILYSIALFFIGMSIFADKEAMIGVLITLVGYGSLLLAAILSIIRAIKQNKKND